MSTWPTATMPADKMANSAAKARLWTSSATAAYTGRLASTTASAEASATRQPRSSGTNSAVMPESQQRSCEGVVPLFGRTGDRGAQRPVGAVDLTQVLVVGNLAMQLGVEAIDVGVVLAPGGAVLRVEQHLVGVQNVGAGANSQLVLAAETDGVDRAGLFPVAADDAAAHVELVHGGVA